MNSAEAGVSRGHEPDHVPTRPIVEDRIVGGVYSGMRREIREPDLKTGHLRSLRPDDDRYRGATDDRGPANLAFDTKPVRVPGRPGKEENCLARENRGYSHCSRDRGEAVEIEPDYSQHDCNGRAAPGPRSRPHRITSPRRTRGSRLSRCRPRSSPSRIPGRGSADGS